MPADAPKTTYTVQTLDPEHGWTFAVAAGDALEPALAVLDAYERYWPTEHHRLVRPALDGSQIALAHTSDHGLRVSETTQRDHDLGQLAQLRRLYHHIVHGGRTTLADELWIGGSPTKENVARMIRDLERRTR
jgi:hypothetical protein